MKGGLIVTSRGWLGAALAAAMVVLVSPAGAAVMTDRYEASARVAVQNTFHHDGVDDIEWVQERNEFRFDLRYDLIPSGASIPLLNRARANILYRARYDAIFDIRDRYGEIGLRRDDFRFPEGKIPRELFLDLDFKGIPLSTRIGRQQVVWGEADLFRSLDIVNPLRLDQQGLIGDDFSEYREPLWIAKFLWDVGQVGPIAGTGVEVFWSPNWRPLTERIIVDEAFRMGLADNVALGGLPHRRPHAKPFNQVRHPWAVQRVGPYRTDAANQADLSDGNPPCNTNNPNPLQQGCADFAYLINNDVPTSLIDIDTSMQGVRILGKTWAGLDFTLNYMYKKSEVPGTSLLINDLFDPEIAQDGSPNPRTELVVQAATTPTDELVRRCVFDKEPLFILGSLHGETPYDTEGGNALTGCESVTFWYPWSHIVGGTLTYSDYDYTGMIFRLEQSYSTKEPRNNIPPLAGDRAGEYPRTYDFENFIKRNTSVWRSMVGFDYLRALWNPAPPWIRDYWVSTFLKDQWFFTFQFFNEYYSHTENQIGLLDSVTDRMQHWNPVLTFLATGFFHHFKLRPTLAAGYDVNADFPVVWLQAEYSISKQLTVRLGEIMYLGSANNESFIFLHKYADRDNLYFRVTYFLL